ELMGTLGKTTISVPRARLETTEGGTTEWKSQTLSAYRRRTKEVEALIAGSYLADTNTRRVGRALASLFRGAVSKDTVSRVWRKIKGDWEAWNRRDLSTEDIVRLIPMERRCVYVSIAKRRRFRCLSCLEYVAMARRFCLPFAAWAERASAAWRTVLDDLVARRLKKPTIVDGAPGLE